MAATFFTVLTPTYNRAHTLPRVYDSLSSQTFRDFEWVVVDDGSTDNSERLIRTWQDEAQFTIRYFKQPNSHKKTAFNHGVREARGRFLLCLDSDDAMPPGALQIFRDTWNSIPESEREGFSGVAGLCIDEAGRIVGDRFPSNPLDSDDLTLRFRLGVEGEKWAFHRVDILKQYPFPESILGFVVESVVWNAIARKYRTRYVNEIVRIYYREADSLVNSRKTLSKLRAIAQGSSYAYREFIDHDKKWFFSAPVQVLKVAANLTRFTWHARRGGSDAVYHPATLGGKILKAITWTIGFGAFIFDELLLSSK